MTDLELPLQSEKTRIYRFWEMAPGMLSWSLLILPFVLGYFSPITLAVFYISYLLIWFFRAMSMSVYSVKGFLHIKRQSVLKWHYLLDDLEARKIIHPHAKYPKWHKKNIDRLAQQRKYLKPSNITHAIITAVYTEDYDIVDATIKAVIDSHYDTKKVIFILAYEERAGKQYIAQSNELIQKYKKYFKDAFAVMHPAGITNEILGKGPNITYAAHSLKTYLELHHIDPITVPVTTLDGDNRVDKNYLAALTYTYCSTEDQRYVSYQPVAMYTNNIWDAPAAMRVIATGNTFWNVVLSQRHHILRNFSAHAQSMQALIDTNFWSVRSIVEDGHQFWRTYFAYNGRHEVFPIFAPIYQDAVLTENYRKTLRQQFVQLRRWAYGASDIAYVATKGFRKGNKIPKWDLLMKLGRLIEGHVSWATTSILIILGPNIPATLHKNDYISSQLPTIAGYVQQIATIGLIITMFLSLLSLPPKPARYKRHRHFSMVFQWILLPFTTIIYNTSAAINSQTRLLFGWYLTKFDFTHKAIKK